jgi:hypothetical protein
MLLNENHEMIPLIINSLSEDLNSRAPKAGTHTHTLHSRAFYSLATRRVFPVLSAGCDSQYWGERDGRIARSCCSEAFGCQHFPRSCQKACCSVIAKVLIFLFLFLFCLFVVCCLFCCFYYLLFIIIYY